MGQVIPPEPGGNIKSQTIGANSTTSGSLVSTGSGVTMTVRNNGNVLAVGAVQTSAVGAAIRLTYAFFFSTVGIPASGSPPNGGDVQIGTSAAWDPPSTAVINTLPMLGLKTGATGTFYVYAAFMSGNGVNTNNLAQGTMVVSET